MPGRVVGGGLSLRSFGKTMRALFVILMGVAVAWACTSLLLAIKRFRGSALRLIVPALILGVTTGAGWWYWLPSIVRFKDLTVWDDVRIILMFPGSMALDPLHLPLDSAIRSMLVLYSLIATALWYRGLDRLRAAWKARATLSDALRSES